MSTTVAPATCTVPAADLERWVKSVGRVAKAASTIQVLGCVRMTPGAVAATDIATVVSVEAPGMELDAVVPMVHLAAAIGTLDRKQEVTLSLDEATLTVEQGRMRTTIQVMNVGDYPVLPEVEMPAHVHLGPDQVRSIMAVATAASSDETRPVLTGVELVIDSADGGGIRAAATDSYRLIDWQGTPDKVEGLAGRVALIVPAEALRLVAGAKGDGGGLVIGLDPNNQEKVTLRAGTTTVVRSLINGQFPNPDALIPDTFSGTLHLDDESAEDLLRLLGSVGPSSNTPARIAVQLHAETARVTVVDDNVMRELTVGLTRPWTGDDLEIGLNPAYIGATMQAVGSHDIHVISPLRPVGVIAPGFRGLCMPVRLNG